MAAFTARKASRIRLASTLCAALGSCAIYASCTPSAPPAPGPVSAAASASSPQAAPAPALENWLVENFEQPNGLSGGFWYEFDKNALGTVAKPNPFQLEAGGASASPGSCAHISGTLGADHAPWTWVQLQVFLNREKQPVDLRGYKSLHFFVKGDGGRYSVSLVRSAVKNYDNFKYEFTAPTTWTELHVPLVEFKQAGWGVKLPQQFDDVTMIQFSPAAHDKAFDVSFDHVSLTTREVKLEPVAYDTKDWFPWAGIDPVKRRGTALDVSRLLDAPAGKHGPLTRKGDRFVFRNGKPVRFWGVNIVASANFPSHAEAERLAELLAQLGVNMTRHHHIDAAWSKPNVFGNRPTTLELDANAMERFDYFIKELQKRGIYQFFDMLVHRKITDADGVPGAKELTAGLKIEGEFAPALVALEEQFVDQFMGHKNPYTGRTYAADPAVALLEAINEDSLFWIQKEGDFALKPAFRATLNGLFSSYLKKAVPGGRAALEARWANKAGGPGQGLRADEDPEKGNVDATLWLADDPTRASPGRTEDTLRFLYETELGFYRRIETRLRKLGYKGLVAGSNHWVEHPLDLLANAQLDFVDRHSYWSHPNGGWGYNTGISWDPSAMVKDPNLGVVGSLARRRVKGLPYATSEWQTSAPNDFREEGALLVGAYAAFQDSSPLQFAFSHDGNKKPDAPGALNNNFDVIDQPAMLGAWPAVSLLFHRGDVKRAPLEACLKVDPKEAFKGAVANFPTGLAQVARIGIDFNGGMSVAELTALRDKHVKGTVTTSSTGELRHDASNGRFEVDTARSQAFAGFRPTSAVTLGNATIELASPFAVLTVSALDDAPIASAKRVLVSALGNAVNTGMSLTPGGNSIVNPGTAPTLVEPIRAKVTLIKLTGNLEKARAYALGSSGERMAEVPLVRDQGSLSLSIGPAHRTLHYEIVRE